MAFEEKPSKDALEGLAGVSKNSTDEDPFEVSPLRAMRLVWNDWE